MSVRAPNGVVDSAGACSPGAEPDAEVGPGDAAEPNRSEAAHSVQDLRADKPTPLGHDCVSASLEIADPAAIARGSESQRTAVRGFERQLAELEGRIEPEARAILTDGKLRDALRRELQVFNGALRGDFGGFITYGNDALVPQEGGPDDNGLTSGFVVGVERKTDNGGLGLEVEHMSITERDAVANATPEGGRRVDLVDAKLHYWRRFDHNDMRWQVDSAIGVSYVGDAGGLEIQEWAHGTLGWGSKQLGAGLQSIYPDRAHVAPFLELGAATERALGPRASARAGADVRLAGAQSLSRARVFLEGSYSIQFKALDAKFTAGAAAEAYASDHPELTMSGGHQTGRVHTDVYGKMELEVRRVGFAWGAHSNYRGSDGVYGFVTISYRPGGK